MDADNVHEEVVSDMWISFIAGWILGSASLYLFLIVTAREPANDECVECRELACAEDCPYEADLQESGQAKAA